MAFVQELLQTTAAFWWRFHFETRSFHFPRFIQDRETLAPLHDFRFHPLQSLDFNSHQRYDKEANDALLSHIAEATWGQPSG